MMSNFRFFLRTEIPFYFTSTSSYSSVPMPIFFAWSMQHFQLVSGKTEVKWSSRKERPDSSKALPLTGSCALTASIQAISRATGSTYNSLLLLLVVL